MSHDITIHLFGSLRKTTDRELKSSIMYHLKESLPLIEIIKDLKISEGRVQLVMINHRAASTKTIIRPGDRVALFPSEYPIFADWKNLRAKPYF